MKLDDLYADAAKVFVSTNKAAGMAWYAGMSADEETKTVASFAGNAGFQAALGRVLAVLATEAGTEGWVVEHGPDGDHLVRRTESMTSAMLLDAFNRLALVTLDQLARNLDHSCMDPAGITSFRLSCELQADDLPTVMADGVIGFRYEGATDEPSP